MSSPIPDGNYKIINVAYPSQDADLIYGNAVGPVQGYVINTDSTHMVWTLTNVGHNQVTLLNASSNTYAQVSPQIKDAVVTGNENPTTWTLVPSKVAEYLITVGNHSELAWKLTGKNNYDPIKLEPTVKSDTTENWTFLPV